MPKSTLSQSLLELSDAIEQLANIITQQKEADNAIQIQQFSLIVNRFKNTTQQLSSENNINHTPAKNNQQHILKAYQKGYLKNWLAQHNIITADYIENLKVDDYLFAAVEYLADHYQHLHAFYKQLKYHQNIRKNFTHHTSANSISYIKKWCTMLQQHHLIDAFKIENENIYIDIAEVHNATYFIYGYWLELLLRREIAQLLHQHLSHIQSFDIISQASVMLPDKQLTELDLLLMVNNQVYWFECKSGTIQTYYEKFNQHRKIMKLDAQHAFLIIPHRDANIALQTQKRSGMTTLYGIELEQQLQEIIFKN